MIEVSVPKPFQNFSTGIVGTVGCWTIGIGVVAAAVAFSVAGEFTTKLFGLVALLLGSVICGFARTASTEWKLRLTAISVLLGALLLLTEFGLRLATGFPVDPASQLITHAELGYVLNPDLKDVDINGFRNSESAAQPVIIAIGDAQTQGTNVAAAAAWPQWLSQQLNQPVTSLAVKGYGPDHYQRLLNQALDQQPQHIVIGLYPADDLADSSRGIRPEPQPRSSEVQNTFRQTMAQRTATGGILQQLFTRSTWGRAAGFEIPHTVTPAFVSAGRIEQMSHNMDPSRPQISTALQNTVQFLTTAAEACAAKNVRLTVLLIPTRETVYFHSQHSDSDTWPDSLQQVVRNEAGIVEQLRNLLQEQQVELIDPRVSLTAAVDAGTAVYASYDEPLPLAEGYRLYAAAVAATTKTAAEPQDRSVTE